MFKKAVFIMGVLIMASACTNSGDIQDLANNTPLVLEEDAIIETAADDSLHIVLFGRTLSNIDAFIAYFNGHIADTQITVERLTYEDAVHYSERHRTGLSSGNAPDIIHIKSDLDYDLSNSAYLTDLMPFIENDPDFHMENYYENVIEALKLNHRLPYIPISFDIAHIGINANCTELISAFNHLDTAPYAQLIPLYQSMPARYGYDFCPQFYILDVVYSSDYIDFRNRTAHYNSQAFIDSLTEALQINNSLSVAATSDYLPAYGDTHLFQAVNHMEQRIFMPAKEPYISLNTDLDTQPPINVPSEFIDFKPLSNSTGAIPFYTITFPLLAISESSTNKDSAWAFIKLLLSDEFYPIFNNQSYSTNLHQIFLNKTVDKKMAEDYFTGYMKDALDTDHLSGEILADSEDTIAKLQGYASMPMVHDQSYPSKLNADINSVVEQLVSGQNTPEQAALQLHNMTALAFNE